MVNHSNLDPALPFNL